MDRRSFLKQVLLATGSIVISSKSKASNSCSARPNIIFILTDDQRKDTLGCMGNDIVRTPNIDRLAREGTLFENASVTSALCTPSRATIFTGTYERCHGVNFNSGTSLSEEAWQLSYPMQLKKTGYFVGYVGKNHTPVGEAGYGTGMMDASFDYWYARHGHLTFYPKQVPPRPNHPEGEEKMFHNAKADTQVEILEEGTKNFLEPNEAFYAQAARFLERRPDNKPFCLSVCFNLPHAAGIRTMKSRPSDPDLYKTAYMDQREQIRQSLSSTYVAKDDIKKPKLPSEVLIAEKRQPSYKYVNTPETMTDHLTRVYQTITGIDKFVGSVRSKLKELNLSDNTIIVFASDHGIMYGEFGLGGKALNYESCLNIPLIIYDPHAPANSRGQKRKELVQTIDIAPTLIDYAQQDIPDNMQGQSLIPLIHGRQVAWREYAFAENLWSTVFGNPRIESVRSDEWKYIRYFKNDPSLFEPEVKGMDEYLVSDKQADIYRKWLDASIQGEEPVYEELYHLKVDPKETTNLADNPVYAKILEQYRKINQNLVKQARGQKQIKTISLLQERLDRYRQNLTAPEQIESHAQLLANFENTSPF